MAVVFSYICTMKVWFIADTHFSHLNALYFKPKRREAAGISLDELKTLPKSETIERHDKWLIELWNETVKREDTVYILGDFCLGNKIATEKILSKLHGKKFLIRGNHDKSCNGLERYFEGVYDIKEAKFNHAQFPFIKEGETFCIEMCHYPLLAWNRRTHGTCMVHGHTHGTIDKLNKDSKELRVDVGLDSELAGLNFISLEKLYGHFREIVVKSGCDTFQDYNDKLMEEQGYRM